MSSISHPVPKKRYQSTGTMVISFSFVCDWFKSGYPTQFWPLRHGRNLLESTGEDVLPPWPKERVGRKVSLDGKKSGSLMLL